MLINKSLAMNFLALALVIALSGMTLAIEPEDIQVPLWPEGAPGALGNEPKDVPTLTVRKVESSNPTGALIICPGGGYGGLAMDHEGKQIVQWANSMGLTAVLCDYRHRGKGYGHPAPSQDALRAVRLVRAKASEWNIDPNKIGIMGFSAGGHLVSTVITQFDPGSKESTDTVARGSEVNLLGEKASKETLEQFASERHVRSDTPPTFLMHTVEDKPVPVENSLVFYQAMVAKQVPGELHIYQKGPHGVGLARNIPGTSDWPLACQRWLKELQMVP
jgi:acetyl esterase/lipase